MRKLTFAAVLAVALVATSIAVAHGIEGAKTTTAVAGTFTATQASTTTRTCTTQDGKSLSITDGKYTGTATGSPDLTGNITLHARSVVNTTDNVGTVDGSFRIDVANSKDTTGAFSTVYTGGTVAGLATGRAHEPKVKLVANLSATFAQATGFTNGKLGGVTAGGGAVEVGPGSCKPAKPTKEHSEARGTISALTATSITVAGLTCATPNDLTPKFKAQDVVEIKCSLVNGTNTLTRIEKKGHH